jgi:CHASE2 domain-containing sensor protein
MPDAEPLKFRADLIKLLVMALPGMFVAMAVDWLNHKITTQPWQAAWILAPVIIAAYVVWQVVKGRREFRIGGLFLGFFLAYVLIFSIAAETGVLDVKRSLSGYEQSVPRNFLALNRFGDWHYFFAPKLPPQQNLTLVTMDPARTLEDRRADMRLLITLAARNGARGVAFDFYLNQNADLPAVDQLLCAEIQDAKNQGLPVFAGYTYQAVRGTIRSTETASSLKPCFPEQNLGHLVGFLEWDNVVRYVPLHFMGNQNQPSLSLRIASRIAGVADKDLAKPQSDLLQFITPDPLFTVVSLQDLKHWQDVSIRAILRDQFVLVGEKSSADSFPTAFGQMLGVLIHASAVHSLLQHHYIERVPWWPNFGTIFAFCYLITALIVQGLRATRLVALLAALSAGTLAFAALAMYLWLIWIDVIYFLAAIWLLLILLLGLRKLTPLLK